MECNTIEEAKQLVLDNTKPKENKEKVSMVPGSIWHWLCTNSCFKGMPSIEMPGKVASNSEKRRWIEQKSILLNGKTDWHPNDMLDFELDIITVEPEDFEVGELLFPDPTRLTVMLQSARFIVNELVFFPNAKVRKCTMV